MENCLYTRFYDFFEEFGLKGTLNCLNEVMKI